MSEVKEKKTDSQLTKVLGWVWLVTTIICWILYIALGASIPFIFIAITVTIAGPVLMDLIYYLIKERKQEVYDLNKMMGGLWFAAMIFSWISYGILGATVPLFFIAISVTIAGPPLINVIIYLIKRKKQEVSDLNIMIGGLLAAGIILSWITYAVLGATTPFFIIAMIITIT